MKILYFIPDCIITRKAGNITRFKQTLAYLNNAENCEVDFVSIKNVGGWDDRFSPEQQFKELYPNLNLIVIPEKPRYKSFIEKYIDYKIPNILPKIKRFLSPKKELDFSVNYPYFERKFAQIVNAKKYDKIIITYAVWGNLVKKIKYKTHLILDTHDFITGQNRDKKDKIGKIFQEEMDIINLFDEIWTFSIEEKYIFEQFSDKKIVHLPIGFEHQPLIKNEAPKKYDILYIASHNPHNIKSIYWFLEKVLPFINVEYKIHIVGHISEKIDRDYPNVIIHGLVDDIAEFYNNAKITICPMLSGTGVKIKVLESLSYNLPIVTNTRGVDGLTNKSENGCIVKDEPIEFAQAINTLLSNTEEYQKLQDKAHSYFANHHQLGCEKEFFNKLLS